MDQQAQTGEDILYDLRDGIGWITFNRPQARNAFTFAMYERLAAICEQATAIVRSRCSCFEVQAIRPSSGTNINQFRKFRTPKDAFDYENRIDRVLTTLEPCRVPTIAAIKMASAP